MTRGALYHHFADKADLFRAVVEREARAVAEQIERESADPSSALEALMDGAEAYFKAMAVPGRVRLLLRDGPSVLGHAEMDRIDRETGAEELRQGLAFAMEEGALAKVPLDALTDIVSAAFDRAALAIAEGRPADDYGRAVRLILSSLIGRPLDPFILLRKRFDRVFGSTGKARVPPWTCRLQGGRNAVQRARKTRPSVGQIGPPAALRHLPDAPHRAARRASPDEPIWLHQTLP